MTQIATLIFVIVSGVFLSSMIDDFLDEGMIFERWGKYLESNPDKWILKPLGGCIICLNIWILIGCFFANVLHPPTLAFLFVLSCGHWFMKIMIKYELL